MITFYNESREGRSPKYYIIHKVNPLLTSVFSSKGYWEENKHLEDIMFGEENYTSGELKDLKKGSYEIIQNVVIEKGSIRDFEIDKQALEGLLPKHLM